MKLTTFVETTLGPLEVETETVDWIWTFLTFGIFKKAICRITGPAIERYEKVKESARKDFGGSKPEGSEFLKETHIFRTCRVTFWHDFIVEYVQAQAGCISNHHWAIQWFYKVDAALNDGNKERVQELFQEYEARCRAHLEGWGRLMEENGD